MILGPLPTPTRCLTARPSGSRPVQKPRATGGTSVRITPPPPASAPPARPAPTRTATRRPSFAFGIAAPFGVAGRPRSGSPVGFDGDGEAVLMPGAFDRSLAAVGAGRRVVRLLLNHDPDLALCDTSDGSLSLWADGESLNFKIDGTRRRGRRALVMLAAAPGWRACSVGGLIRDRMDVGDTRYVYRIMLQEISILAAGAFPGTRLKLW